MAPRKEGRASLHAQRYQQREANLTAHVKRATTVRGCHAPTVPGALETNASARGPTAGTSRRTAHRVREREGPQRTDLENRSGKWCSSIRGRVKRPWRREAGTEGALHLQAGSARSAAPAQRGAKARAASRVQGSGAGGEAVSRAERAGAGQGHGHRITTGRTAAHRRRPNPETPREQRSAGHRGARAGSFPRPQDARTTRFGVIKPEPLARAGESGRGRRRRDPDAHLPEGPARRARRPARRRRKRNAETGKST